jgi:hypothetical protein
MDSFCVLRQKVSTDQDGGRMKGNTTHRGNIDYEGPQLLEGDVSQVFGRSLLTILSKVLQSTGMLLGNGNHWSTSNKKVVKHLYFIVNQTTKCSQVLL